MKMIPQFNIIVAVVVIIALTSILSFSMIGNYYHHGLDLIYAQQVIDSDNASNSIIKLDNIHTKQVRVGDIDISYKTFGKGDPILLIMGYAGSMYMWDPIFLKGYLQIIQS